MNIPNEETIRSLFPEEPEKLFQSLLEMSNWIQSFLPEHSQLIRWNIVVFDKPKAKATVLDCICTLHIRSQKLILGIPTGAMIEDPHKRMVGNGRYKRFVHLKPPIQIPDPELQDLILRSYHFQRGKQPLYKQLKNEDYKELRKNI